MNRILEKKENGNQFDNLKVDVEKIFQQYHFKKNGTLVASKNRSKEYFFQKIYSSPLISIRWKNYIWHMLRRTNLDQSWFKIFSKYWSEILKGRPLWSPYDLFYLKNHYRIKFQNKYLPYSNSPSIHLKAWQEWELLYLLLHYATKESFVNYSNCINWYKKLRYKKSNTILEYGCSCAPITTTFFEFLRSSQNDIFFLCDLQCLPFHYATYKFRNLPNVIPILLNPENNFQLTLEKKVDVIFCLMVFEHLNEPLKTVKNFHQILNDGGVLFFDYIKGDGEGHDTFQAVKQRNEVLEFICKHFTLLTGKIDKSESTKLTIVRK